MVGKTLHLLYCEAGVIFYQKVGDNKMTQKFLEFDGLAALPLFHHDECC